MERNWSSGAKNSKLSASQPLSTYEARTHSLADIRGLFQSGHSQLAAAYAFETAKSKLVRNFYEFSEEFVFIYTF